MSMMSLSPTTSTSNYDDQPSGKRRRTTSFTVAANGGPRSDMASPQDPSSGLAMSPSVPSAHIPKRGARACTNFRKGKNRCEGEVRIAKQEASHYYATDLSAITQAGGLVWSGWGSPEFSQEAIWAKTITPLITSGQSIADHLGEWQTAIKNQARVTGYQVK